MGLYETDVAVEFVTTYALAVVVALLYPEIFTPVTMIADPIGGAVVEAKVSVAVGNELMVVHDPPVTASTGAAGLIDVMTTAGGAASAGVGANPPVIVADNPAQDPISKILKTRL